MLFWNSLAFSMIQQMLAIWTLVPLPFLNPFFWFLCLFSILWDRDSNNSTFIVRLNQKETSPLKVLRPRLWSSVFSRNFNFYSWIKGSKFVKSWILREVICDSFLEKGNFIPKYRDHSHSDIFSFKKETHRQVPKRKTSTNIKSGIFMPVTKHFYLSNSLLPSLIS